MLTECHRCGRCTEAGECTYHDCEVWAPFRYRPWIVVESVLLFALFAALLWCC